MNIRAIDPTTAEELATFDYPFGFEILHPQTGEVILRICPSSSGPTSVTVTTGPVIKLDDGDEYIDDNLTIAPLATNCVRIDRLTRKVNA